MLSCPHTTLPEPRVAMSAAPAMKNPTSSTATVAEAISLMSELR
jgi:hypothetical protein